MTQYEDPATAVPLTLATKPDVLVVDSEIFGRRQVVEMAIKVELLATCPSLWCVTAVTE